MRFTPAIGPLAITYNIALISEHLDFSLEELRMSKAMAPNVVSDGVTGSPLWTKNWSGSLPVTSGRNGAPNLERRKKPSARPGSGS